ncbi:MAG: homoserine dehydrogenase [Bacillota bacterium]
MSDRRFGLALIGYGYIGRELARLLAAKRAGWQRQYGVDLYLAAAAGRSWSRLAGPGQALDPDRLPESGRLVDRAALLESDEVRIWVEATPTNLETGEPGLSYLREALRRGKHAVVLTKGPLVLDLPGLLALARASGVGLRFSGATAAALPTIDVATYSLAGMTVESFAGILNGTTNYILTCMANGGLTYQAALAEARARGIAEADPRLDVEGWDTAAKTLILANAILGAGLTLDQVRREGIADLTPQAVAAASEQRAVVKLVGEARRCADRVEVTVAPRKLPADHLLAGVSGTNKGIIFQTAEMGEIAVIGGGSDPRAAAAAALKDCLNIATR